MTPQSRDTFWQHPLWIRGIVFTVILVAGPFVFVTIAIHAAITTLWDELQSGSREYVHELHDMTRRPQ
jgi:hypothetical protein